MTVMDWQHADPDVEIGGCIHRLEEDQQQQAALAARAHLTELDALDVARKAQNVQAACVARILEDDAEITRLRAEIPRQR